ncbi:MAG: winged helix-turn-helix domain-containing protein [Solirubrobacterales bacterium]|nr:winged helix-turn-helix domain-containing protein [Solirubrobacterales bacterium]
MFTRKKRTIGGDCPGRDLLHSVTRSSRPPPRRGLGSGLMTIETIVAAPATRFRAVRCANLELRPSEPLALAEGRPVDLTAREFQLLLALAERRGRVVPRHELYEQVWRRRMAYRDRAVDVFVRKLRLKLAQAAPGWVYIHTHFGVGYRLAPQRLI